MRLNFLKKAGKKKIIALAIVACAVIIAMYYFLFLSSVISNLVSTFRKASEEKNKIRQAELSIKKMPQMRKEIEEFKAKAGFYSDKLPKEEEFPAILESLSNMAKNTGVKITKIMPIRESQPPASGQDIYRQKEILITALCGYHQLGTFISELESAERFMEVSDIKIEGGRANAKQHSVQLVVKAFILKGEEK